MAYRRPHDDSRVNDDRTADSRVMDSRAMENEGDDLFNPLMQLQGPFPDLPPLPGYHYKWVYYLNELGQEDPTQVISHLNAYTGGYEYVKPEEIPPLASMKIGMGAHVGFVGMRGNVLMKIRHSRWLKLQAMSELKNQQAMGRIQTPSVAGGDSRAPVSAQYQSTFPTPGRGRVPSDPNI